VIANNEEDAKTISNISLGRYDSIEKVCDIENIINPGVMVGTVITVITKEQLDKIKVI
jgi:hypothetical protein